MNPAPTLDFHSAFAQPAAIISSNVEWVEDFVMAMERAPNSMARST